MKARILQVAMLLALAACASTGARIPAAPAVDYSQYAGPEVESIHFYRLDGWEVVGHDELLLWAGLREAYLLKVWEPCTELEYAQAIGFTSNFNRVTRFDKVRAGHDLCPIGSIRKLDVARLKADRAKARSP
ncbi:MAG: hypothetical protein RLZZ200_703 [Pseudomonadota bacterium]|jgi:hypothetical protein